MSALRAIADLRAKLALERPFMKKLRTLNNRITRDFKKGYSEEGQIINAELYKEDFEELLIDQYAKTGKIFSDRIGLPSDVEKTDEETITIDQALALFYLSRSGEQAQVITNTNQKDLVEALEIGIRDAQEEEGAFSRADAAAFGALALAVKLRGRESSVAMTETQVIAEASKLTEAEVLVNATPSITGGSPTTIKIEKEWFTVGDEKVRLAHMVSDGQVVNMNEPFIVGGELMKFPGDMSLDASVGNTINCRCTSMVSQEKIISERRAVSLPEAFATVN